MREIDTETVEAMWDASVAGIKLIHLRGIRFKVADIGDSYSGAFRTAFIKKSKILESYKSSEDSLNHTEELFENWLRDRMNEYSRHDRKMMAVISRFVRVALAKGFEGYGYFKELDEIHQEKIKKKFYLDFGFDLQKGVNSLGDKYRDEFELNKIPRHQQIMEQDVESVSVNNYTHNEEEDLRKVKTCQKTGTCNDPSYCSQCRYCYIDSLVSDQTSKTPHLEGYMPNFFEDHFPQDELQRYDPKWVNRYAKVNDSSRALNPASNLYQFNVNWACTDQHLIDEFRKWIYMRRPEDNQNNLKKLKNKKLSLKIQDFRFWHVDHRGVAPAPKMMRYSKLYGFNNSEVKVPSDRQVRNSANAGLRFFELSVLSYLYVNSYGYETKVWDNFSL